MPTVLQASISRVPPGADTFLPSTLMFTSWGVSAISSFATLTGVSRCQLSLCDFSLCTSVSSVVNAFEPITTEDTELHKGSSTEELTQTRAASPPCQPFQTDTACPPNDLQIPF